MKEKDLLYIECSEHIKQNGLWDTVDYRIETYVNGEYKPELHTQQLVDNYVTWKEELGHKVIVRQ